MKWIVHVWPACVCRFRRQIKVSPRSSRSPVDVRAWSYKCHRRRLTAAGLPLSTRLFFTIVHSTLKRNHLMNYPGYVLEMISFRSTYCWNNLRALRLLQGHWLARASYKILITVYRRVRSMMMIEVKRHTSTGLQFLRTVRDNNPRGSIVTVHYSIAGSGLQLQW